MLDTRLGDTFGSPSDPAAAERLTLRFNGSQVGEGGSGSCAEQPLGEAHGLDVDGNKIASQALRAIPMQFFNLRPKDQADASPLEGSNAASELLERIEFFGCQAEARFARDGACRLRDAVQP